MAKKKKYIIILTSVLFVLLLILVGRDHLFKKSTDDINGSQAFTKYFTSKIKDDTYESKVQTINRLVDSGKINEAVKYTTSLPNNYENEGLLAYTYSSTHRDKDALKIYKILAKQRPQDSTMLEVAAETAVRANDKTTAIKFYKMAKSAVLSSKIHDAISPDSDASYYDSQIKELQK